MGHGVGVAVASGRLGSGRVRGRGRAGSRSAGAGAGAGVRGASPAPRGAAGVWGRRPCLRPLGLVVVSVLLILLLLLGSVLLPSLSSRRLTLEPPPLLPPRPGVITPSRTPTSPPPRPCTPASYSSLQPSASWGHRSPRTTERSLGRKTPVTDLPQPPVLLCSPVLSRVPGACGA